MFQINGEEGDSSVPVVLLHPEAERLVHESVVREEDKLEARIEEDKLERMDRLQSDSIKASFRRTLDRQLQRDERKVVAAAATKRKVVAAAAAAAAAERKLEDYQVYSMTQGSTLNNSTSFIVYSSDQPGTDPVYHCHHDAGVESIRASIEDSVVNAEDSRTKADQIAIRFSRAELDLVDAKALRDETSESIRSWSEVSKHTSTRAETVDTLIKWHGFEVDSSEGIDLFYWANRQTWGVR